MPDHERERELTPRQTVSELDRDIVGQAEAKRAVAIALRNWWRRRQLPDESRSAGNPQEHHADRADRRWQNRDRPPAGDACGCAVCEGGGDQVHRGWLCGAATSRA